jgi:integrase
VLEQQQELVRELEKSTDQIIPWVFVHYAGQRGVAAGDRVRGYRHAWAAACRAAGVPGHLVHDFRRSSVRNLERAGIPRSAAMKLTGHLTETIYRRYAIVDEGMMREAAEKLSALHSSDRSSEAAREVVPLTEGRR